MKAQHWWALHSVAKNIGRTFSHGAFENLDLDLKVDIMIRYWTLIADTHPEEWVDASAERRQDFEYKLLELTGLIAWSYAASDILGPAFDPDRHVMNWDAVRHDLEKTSGCVDRLKSGEFIGRTGEVGGKAIGSTDPAMPL